MNTELERARQLREEAAKIEKQESDRSRQEYIDQVNYYTSLRNRKGQE